MNANQTNQTTNTREATRNRLFALIKQRNILIDVIAHGQKQFEDWNAHGNIITQELNKVVHELCETIAQIAVYKTLLKLSDGAKDITQSGADMCDRLYRAFNLDMHIYRTGDLSEIYTDAMDLFDLAYIEAWQYLKTSAPLTLEDTVYTRALKNGDEKNYTLFQSACKSIREYIHSWSKTDSYKKLHYVIGFTDNGEQVTTSTRPQDDLTDITAQDRKRVFNKYGLTAQQQEILHLIVNGEKADTIATLLNMPLRTVQDNIKKAKAKFKTASAYAEYITAKNAEKTARAKAEKHETDKLYQGIYAKAQERTARALKAWQDLFHKAN